MLVLVPLDMNKNEVRNALVHVLAADPSSPTEGQIYYNSVSKTLRFYTGATWIVLGRLDQVTGPQAPLSMSALNIQNLAVPVNPTDAATKAYVDGVAQGLSWKDSVRAATTTAGTLGSSFAAGQTVDAVLLATGDRLLVKNQAAGQENGIYIAQPSGAPVRAADANSALNITAATVLVEEGLANADTLWTLTTNAPISPGTTVLSFVQVGAGTTMVGGAGLTTAGNVMNVGAGTGIAVNADDVALTVPVAVANGGTGGTTAAAARTALGAVGKYAVSLGNGALTSIVVNHALGTTDVVVMVSAVSGGAKVYPDITVTDANNVTLAFAVAPTSNQFRAVVVG